MSMVRLSHPACAMTSAEKELGTCSHPFTTAPPSLQMVLRRFSLTAHPLSRPPTWKGSVASSLLPGAETGGPAWSPPAAVCHDGTGRSADERARTADLISLRMIIQALQGFANPLTKPISFLCLVLRCTELRSRGCQSGAASILVLP